MEIVAKNPEDVTPEDIDFLRQNYTSMGGLLPKGFNGGAFFTPTHVARFMAGVIRNLYEGFPENMRVLEPSVGSGVFLEHLPPDAEITALELDETSARVTQLIYPRADVILGNALDHDRRDYYDLVIGNPPYGETVETEKEYATLSKRKGIYRGKSEAAFIELAIKAARPGGYIAFILPMGISFASHAKKVRKLMYETCWQVATIMLPGETFMHTRTTIPTQIIILRKAPPGTPLIESVTKRWASNYRRGGLEDISVYDAKFLAGQTPAYFAKVTDIGWDAKGKTTDKWGDGKTQLDEIIDDFKGTLIRDNLYPHMPSWHTTKDCEGFFFSHGNDTCDGLSDAERTYPEGPYRWNELTLGAGEETVVGGVEWSTRDFSWQDAIVEEWAS
ncbi:HsdM family class I SAM-dependent methyltransferase [Paenibacillus larvae]|uniref:HsdM family class I SAM-dependent methyltransferase n=2 Tax=Paenibacillus larvae TaxID=1464 RepID=UPI0001695000|nr:N-6 DNA methylase [Paenibacillus larvae]